MPRELIIDFSIRSVDQNDFDVLFDISCQVEECKEEVAMELVLEDLIDGETIFLVGGIMQEALLRRVVPLDYAEELVEMQEVITV